MVRLIFLIAAIFLAVLLFWGISFLPKKKPLEQIDATELGIDTKPRIEQIKVEEPPKRKAGIKVASVEELVQKLKNEAKVI